MTPAAAVEIVGTFLSAFPNANADDGTVELWVNALAQCDEQDGKQAAVEWISTSKFFPSIAEFNDILRGYRRRRDMSNGGRYQLGQGAIPEVADGLQLARAAYIAECRHQGREPIDKTIAGFDRGLLGPIRINQETRPA